MNWVSNLSKARTDPKDDVVMNSPPHRGMHTSDQRFTSYSYSLMCNCGVELDDTHYYNDSYTMSP